MPFLFTSGIETRALLPGVLSQGDLLMAAFPWEGIFPAAPHPAVFFVAAPLSADVLWVDLSVEFLEGTLETLPL